MAAEEKWYFTRKQLESSPSRKCNIDAETELQYRQHAANFIQDMGQRLRVNQLCINTAIVYMHRFYVFHSFTQFHKYSIASAALFLAAKVEELPRKLEFVVKTAQIYHHKESDPAITSEQYVQAAHDLVFNENVLLQTLGFDLAIDHPHTHVVRCCHLVNASKDLAQTSYFLASNSLHMTTMCLQYKPTVVACFCIYLACKWSNWKIPPSSEGKQWFTYVDETVTTEMLDELTAEFMTIYNKFPSRLKKKLESMSQNLGQSSNSGHSSSQSGPSSGSSANCNSPMAVETKKIQPGPHGKEDQHPSKLHNPGKPGLPHPQRPPHDYAEYKDKKEAERHLSGSSSLNMPHHKQMNSTQHPVKSSGSIPQNHKPGMPPGPSFPPHRSQHHRSSSNPNIDPKLKIPPQGHAHSNRPNSASQPYPPSHPRPPPEVMQHREREATSTQGRPDPNRDPNYRDPHFRDPNRPRDITAPTFPGTEPPRELFAPSNISSERELLKEKQMRERHNAAGIDQHIQPKENLFREVERPRERFNEIPGSHPPQTNVHKQRSDLFSANKEIHSELNSHSDKLRHEQKQLVPNKLFPVQNVSTSSHNSNVKHDSRHNKSSKEIPSDTTKTQSKPSGYTDPKKIPPVDKSVKVNSHQQQSSANQNRVKPSHNVQDKPRTDSPVQPRNGNHNVLVDNTKRIESESVTQVQPSVAIKHKSIFSPEKEVPKDLLSPSKRYKPSKTSPSKKEVPSDFNVPPALSPFGSPPPVSSGTTPTSKNRNRTSSSSSEPELMVVINKLENIKGYEHMMKENQKGFKLPKNESNNSCSREESPNKEKKHASVIKDEKISQKQEESVPFKSEEGPIVNGIETDPSVISNLLKEVPPIHHVTELKKDEAKDIVPICDVNPVPNPDGRKLEHHRSEKKRKKDKHKHKDKDRSKDEKEKKKKHKDKDRNKDSERHRNKETISESPNAPLKITITKDKITPPSSIHQSNPITSESTLPTSLKIKIPKDRIKPDTLPMLNKSQGSGSLKITISKDKIIENDSSSGTSSRKRERDSGELHGPMSKVSKSSSGHSSSRSSDGNKQNGRHHSNKLQVSHGVGGQVADSLQSQWGSQEKVETKYHNKVSSSSSKQPPK